jgi:hypothetical protein
MFADGTFLDSKLNSAADIFQKYRPISQSVHFVRCDMKLLLKHFVPWQKRVTANFGLRFVSKPQKYGKLTFEQKMRLCLPVVFPNRTRIVVSETRSDWVCLWGNGVHGISGDTIKDHIGEALSLERLEIVNCMSSGPSSSQFNYTGPGEKGRCRIVAAHKESRWEFHQYGDPLPFEDTQSYSARLIKERLPATLLARYCEALGIRLFDEDFYFGRTVVLPMLGQPQTRVVAETFSDPELFPS